ncbi:MAG: aspartate aminotransferase family protein [Legionellales bacterium]|nr:aspartate aminotransferase family protein [Legionellales bacterium]
MVTYNPQNIAFSYGKGVYLFDENDTPYLDAISGIGSCALGHAHPKVTKTIIDQANKFVHCSNAFYITWQHKLAEKLCTLTNMEQIFFANSGTEAVETAIKCLRLYGKSKSISKPKIIVADGAFHGRTFGALSASNLRTRKGFDPLLEGFINVPYNDINSIKQLQDTKDIVGILVEPIQGENGIIIPNTDYLSQLRDICNNNNWLLALDEVQSGVGRTGKLYEYMHHEISPDILISAKGLASGIPIGACLMRGEACSLLTYGTHGSTFGGNPLACHTSHTVLNTLIDEDIFTNVIDRGNFLIEEFKKFNFPNIVEVRGKGLMLAIEIDRPCKEIVKVGIENNILINVTSEKVIRLLPPLIINQEESSELVAKLSDTLDKWCSLQN